MPAEAKPRWRAALPERQLAEMLVVRNRGFAVGTGTLVKNAIACTVAFELARRLHDNELPIFAPTTTLLAIQSSIFGTLGMAVQRVLGTIVGVAGATVFVSTVGLHPWSLATALLAALLVARVLPMGLSAQIQVPLTVLLVMVLGPVDPSYGAWRALDTALGGLVGVAAVVLWPPRVRLAPVRSAYDEWVAALRDQLDAIAAALDQPATILRTGQRHPFVHTSRALHEPTLAARDAIATAHEAARLNPLGRRHRGALAELERRQVQLERITLQVRGLGYVIDRLYDRAGVTPRLPRATLADLLRQLGAVLYTAAYGGSADLLSGRLRNHVDAALHELAIVPGVRLPRMLDSVGILGRIEQLRQDITGAPVVIRFDDELEGDEGELAPEPVDEAPDDAVPLGPDEPDLAEENRGDGAGPTAVRQ
jgi:uncharacterized membrane protein YgaE (UPF0421/DUF939 family)